MQPNISLKKAGLYVGLTFAASWLLAGAFAWSGAKLQSTAGLVMALAYMAVPMLAALAVQGLIYRQPLRGPLRISFRFNRWWLVAWLLPPVLALATFGVSLLLPGIAYAPGLEGMAERFASALTPDQLARMRAQTAALPVHPLWIALAQGLVAGATLNAAAAFGEELGWRGLLVSELRFLGFWRMALTIGLIWGLWHAPLILMGHNFPQHPRQGVFLMTDFTFLFSPLIVYVSLKARSVLAAAVMHGTLNGCYGLAILCVRGGNDLTTGVMGLPGLVVLLAANGMLFVYDRFITRNPVRDELHDERFAAVK